MAEKDTAVAKSEEQLLKQIREDFAYVKSYWQDNHDEAKKDMDCAACIPPKEFSDDRAGRPCLWPDEVSQYVKAANNNFRQNKRGIKISPRSEDAKDTDAEHRQAYIRGIEYASKAQTVYTTAFESAMECAFGFWRVKLIVTGPKGEQEPRIKRIPNWATVYPDPDAQEADFSDSAIYFVTDTMRQSTFARRYPKAKKRSFEGADYEKAPGWLASDSITVAEYWTREEIDEDDGEKRYKVTQRITNGLEILETNEWIGSWIPIVGVFGEEMYVQSGNQSKRMFMSLLRRARVPQQMLAYVASQEAEEFGMMPRAALQGWKGMFDPDVHKLINKVPMGYVEYLIPTDWNVQWGPPPLPSRAQFAPNIQAYELAYERWRRSVMSAMGVNPLPTAAQRQNEKSGIALEKIQNQQAVGSFHFTDNFVRALDNTGRQINELITKLAELDSLPQQLLGKDQKDEDRILKIAPRDASSEHLNESDYFFAHRGQFEVTVSDGPNYQSQREEASEFADTMLQTLPKIGMPPQITQQVLAIAVKLKNIGSYGDEIADLLAPPDPNNLSPQAKAILAQSKGQIQQLTQELQKLQMEKMGKVAETQGKIELQHIKQIAEMAEGDKDRETKIAVAEIATKAQILSERMAAVEDMMSQFHAQAHERGMQAQEHGHQANQADLAAQNSAMQQQTDLAAQQQQSQV
jgi:hypothetical protein